VLIFHQTLWFLFNQIGLIPPERPAWPFDPIPPFGVPSVLSKAFWGGVWGAVLVILSPLRGARYWAAGLLRRCGSFARCLRGAAIKGEVHTEFWPRRRGAHAQRCMGHGAVPAHCGATQD
jgi:hypothetical protein